ncbi:MAG: sulfurtransferase TusA family protein [Sulfitobacter sp.]
MKTHELDATGLLCPLPVLKLRKRLAALPVGDLMRLQTDDPAAIIDVPHFCAETGHALIDMSEEGNVQIFLVRKES